MKTFSKYLIILVVAALLAVAFYLKVYIPKHTFKTIRPTFGRLRVGVKGIGNLGALNIYSITAQTGGRILKILVDEGDWVKKGELLIVMDGVDLPEQLEIARADLLSLRYEVKALQSEMQKQKAQERLQQLTYNRYERLNAQGFAAQAEYDKTLTDLQTVKAELRATASRINSAESTVVAASKKINALHEKIKRLKVYAPVDGYVIYRGAEAAQNVLPSTVVLKVVDPKTLWVETNVDERISAQIKPLQQAVIVLRSQPNKQYQGVVKRVEAMSDPVTLERKINVAFKTIPEPFYINEQAQVVIDVKQYENVLKIPLEVVAQDDGKIGMWTVVDGHAHFTAVDKLGQNETEMAIANGDKNSVVIVPDPHKKSLSEGMVIYQ